MIGMDHSTAPVVIRERYAFTKAAVRSVMQKIHQASDKTSGIRGLLILSTCNRMEFYVSLKQGVTVTKAKSSLTMQKYLITFR